jgi:hypothetical protein
VLRVERLAYKCDLGSLSVHEHHFTEVELAFRVVRSRVHIDCVRRIRVVLQEPLLVLWLDFAERRVGYVRLSCCSLLLHKHRLKENSLNRKSQFLLLVHEEDLVFHGLGDRLRRVASDPRVLQRALGVVTHR